MAKALQDFQGTNATGLLPPHTTIVQCSNCKTRFAVDKRSISELEFPRFHCSRCDHVFSLSEAGVSLNQHDSTAISFPADSAFGSIAYSNSSAPSTLQNDIPRALDIPKDLHDRGRVTAPHEDLSHDTNSDDAQISFGFAANRSSPAENSSRPTVLHPEESNSADRHAPLPRATLDWFDRADQNKVKVDYLPEPDLSLPSHFSSNGWRAVGLLLLPLLLLVGSLLLFSGYLNSGPAESAGLTGWPLAAAPQAAPLGLTLGEISFEQTALDSGDLIQVVKGTLENNSNSDFADIKIEALLYDRNGQKLTSRIASAASGLAQARLSSLTPQLIEKLQNKNLSRTVFLKAGASKDFLIALLPALPDADQIEYFSARIYSVER